jgi:hypothetical protein
VLQGLRNVSERAGGVREAGYASASQAEEPVDVEVVAHNVTCW